jgi:hypothetical protein
LVAAGVRVQFDREVAVGVVYGTEPEQLSHSKAGLLLELPAGRLLRGLALLDPTARKLPETGQ